MNKKIVLIVAVIPLILRGYDTAHFFRATPFFEQARLEHKGLTTFDIRCGYGSTKHAYADNRCTKSHHLWDIYGFSDMHELGVGVPNKDLTNPLDCYSYSLRSSPVEQYKPTAIHNNGQLTLSAGNSEPLMHRFLQHTT